MKLTIKAMTDDGARAVLGWRYEGDYSVYNITADDIEAEIAYMTDPDNHFYIICEGDVPVGHAVFDGEARVLGGDYSADALDVGAGMRPDYTGKGKGASVITTILDFGQEHYQPRAFRATIASWNIRAQKATMKNGFKEVSRFKRSGDDREFIIFMRDA